MMQNYPHPSRKQDPTALELAIYNFELKAKAYYDKKMKSDNSTELKNRLKIDYKHLQLEKKRIESIGVAQSYLEKYREESNQSDLSTLSKESHHPTKKLATFLFAIGEPKPTPAHEAHHIIPGKGRFDIRAILAARLNLHLAGVGINDPFNGTWLINFLHNKEFDWATPDAPPHRKIHRRNYETWIGRTLGQQNNNNKAKFINSLRVVKTHIKTGTLPQQIFEPNTELWKGI